MTTSLSTEPSFHGDMTSLHPRPRWCRPVQWVLVAILLCVPPVWADDAPSLESLVWQYMDASEGSAAGTALDKILADPRATISSVSAVLHHGRLYTSQPTGMLPSVPLTVQGHRYTYALAVPAEYRPTADYGLVLCLHGAGFTGEAYLERWQARLGDRYILACPTHSMGAWWTRSAEELVLATRRDVMARYHVDPNRVFLTGMSNGGIGTWIIGMHHADLFAGLAPMASGIDDVLYPFLANLKQTPVYVIHGSKDQVMPVRLSREVTAELNKLGYTFIYREHDREHPMAGGHYFPREELPDLVAWLDHQRRVLYPESLVVLRDATHLAPFGWLRVDATDRIAAFAENLVEGSDEFITRKVYAKVLATNGGANRIDVAAAHVRRYTLFLSDEMVDPSKPVSVTTNGSPSFDGVLTPSLDTLLRQARLRQDTQRLFPYHVTITVGPTP